MDSISNFYASVNEVCCRMNLHQLKPKQLEAIRTFMSGRDTFVALPTGYGKSIIFAILPMLFDVLFGKHLQVIVYPNEK